MSKKRGVLRDILAIPPTLVALSTPPSTRTKTGQGTKESHVECDAPLSTAHKKPIKANVEKELPTITWLKLRLLPERYVDVACLFYCVAQSLHALRNDDPLTDRDPRIEATVMCNERCGLQVGESGLSLCTGQEKDTWGDRLLGGFRVHHIGGVMPLLCDNTYGDVTSWFGMDTTLTPATMVSTKCSIYHPWVRRYGGALRKGIRD